MLKILGKYLKYSKILIKHIDKRDIYEIGSVIMNLFNH